MDRSSSLLGVRSSDWYQTKALGLYFHAGKLVFVFRKVPLSKLRQNQLTLDRISEQFRHAILNQMWDCWPDGGKKTRIIENQNYHLLPSLRLLLECVLSKYEVITPNSKISGAQLHPMVEVGSRYLSVNNTKKQRTLQKRKQLTFGTHKTVYTLEEKWQSCRL